MVAIPNMNWMGNEPTGSAFDVYRWYMGGGNPVANTGGGGGGGTGIMQAYQPTRGGGGIPGQGLNMADFNAAITARQNRLNNPGKIADWASSFVPQQDSVQAMLARGMLGKKDTRFGGIPLGISGLLSRALPSSYHDKMTLGDQILTQSYMGYTDPNTGMGNKDPFGINIRSAFGNYSEYADKAVDKLSDSLTKSAARKGLTYDPVTGKVTGGTDEEIEAWEKLTKNMHQRIKHYKGVKTKKKDIVADLGLIQKAKDQEKQKAHDKAVSNLKTQHKAFDHMKGNYGPHKDSGGWSPASGSMASGMGGGSQQAKSGSQKSGGSGRKDGGWGWAEGGMIDPDLSKDPEYLGWKKVYKMNPELGSMHEKHPTFIKFYKKHERDQKKFGGLAGLLYG